MFAIQPWCLGGTQEKLTIEFRPNEDSEPKSNEMIKERAYIPSICARAGLPMTEVGER